METIDDDPGTWVCHRALGSGAFGVVELWRNDFTQDMIAIKKCKGGSSQLTQKQKERWIKEVETMNLLNHPNIVETRHVPPQLLNIGDSLPPLCMEYCSHGDLRNLLNQCHNCCGIEEREALKIMYHIASAVEYLHAQQLTHRDLKPENVVLQGRKDQTIYKLTDLGYVRDLGEMSMDASVVGTMNYLAPELLWKKTYTSSVDYWSLGILFYEVVTGIRPFLPNMQLTQTWMKHVMRKSDDDICAKEEYGKVFFKSEIEDPSSISDCMKGPLTTWFRVALQWNPKKRGRRTDPQGVDRLVVFTLLKTILSQKLLYVFVVPLYKIESYIVDPALRVENLHDIIQKRTEIPIAHQVVTDLKGNVFNDANAQVRNYAENSFLIVFNREVLFVNNIPKPKTSLPIKRMIENPRCELDYETSRRYYGAAVSYIKQEMDLFKFYVIALSIKIDLSYEGLESLKDTVQNLTSIAIALLNNLNAYERSSVDILLSNELRDNLTKTTIKTQKLVEGAEKISTNINALCDDSENLKHFSEMNWLNDWAILHEKATKIFDVNAKGQRRQRGLPVEMVKLVYQAFKLHEEQLKNQTLIEFISQITQLDKSIGQLRESLNSFEALLHVYKNNYDVIMNQHLKDEQTSCYALVQSMTPSESVMYDSIVLWNTMTDVFENFQCKVEDMDQLEF